MIDTQIRACFCCTPAQHQEPGRIAHYQFLSILCMILISNFITPIVFTKSNLNPSLRDFIKRILLDKFANMWHLFFSLDAFINSIFQHFHAKRALTFRNCHIYFDITLYIFCNLMWFKSTNIVLTGVRSIIPLQSCHLIDSFWWSYNFVTLSNSVSRQPNFSCLLDSFWN